MSKKPYFTKMKSAFCSLGVVSAFALLSACSVDDFTDFNFFDDTASTPSSAADASSPAEAVSVPYELKGLRAPASIVVCRSKQCAPTTANMSKEFLFNAYYNLLQNNIDTNVLLCDADSASHTCFEPFISFDMMSGVAPANVTIDAARVIDVGIKRDNLALEPVFDYNVYYNGVGAKCNPTVANTYIKNPSYMVIESNNTPCAFTVLGKSDLSFLLTVDYIDLDYGMIGGFYSAGVSGSAYGGGKGYAMMRFQNPVSPEVLCQQQKGVCEPFNPKLPEYDCCTGFGKNKLRDAKSYGCKGCTNGRRTTSGGSLGSGVKAGPIPQEDDKTESK